MFPLPHSSCFMSTLSLFLPSRPPLTPACYLHPPLHRAALTHRRTPPHICRLRPQPTPTLVSNLMSVCDCWQQTKLHSLTNCLCFFSSSSSFSTQGSYRQASQSRSRFQELSSRAWVITWASIGPDYSERQTITADQQHKRRREKKRACKKKVSRKKTIWGTHGF